MKIEIEITPFILKLILIEHLGLSILTERANLEIQFKDGVGESIEIENVLLTSET